MPRKKKPVRNLARVKRLRAKIAEWTITRDSNLQKGLESTAANDQKVIDAYISNLETEIGGSPKQKTNLD